MNLFYYTNDMAARDALGLNAIVCSGANEKSRSLSLGNADPAGIFLTHRKLKEEYRRDGLDETGFDYPVIFKLSFLEKIRAKIECRLVKSCDSGYECEEGQLSDYDVEKHIGVFLPSYIPLSFVTEIIFQSEEGQKNFYQPSPDLWEPKNLYNILNSEEYSEDIDIDALKGTTNVNFDQEKASSSARENCKKRAALYSRLAATSEWRIDKYKLNFDKYVVDTFGLQSEVIEKELASRGTNEKEIFANLSDDILLNKEDDPVLNAVIAELSADDSSTIYDVERFNKIGDRILKELEPKGEKEETVDRYKNALDTISGNLYKSTGIKFDEVAENLEWNQPLGALAVFLKNPHSLELFAESLSVYRIPQQVARVAWGFFGTVNGMKEVSGKDKSKILLNRTIDEIAYGKMSKESFRFPVYSQDELKDLFGDKASEILTDFIPIAERILSFDEVFEYFTSEGKEKLKLNWIKDVCPKVKGFKWSDYVYYQIPDRLEPGKRIYDKKERDIIINELKKEKYDEKRFIDDLCSDKKLFEKFYNAYPEMWKSYYEECNRKVGSDNA